MYSVLLSDFHAFARRPNTKGTLELGLGSPSPLKLIANYYDELDEILAVLAYGVSAHYMSGYWGGGGLHGRLPRE